MDSPDTTRLIFPTDDDVLSIFDEEKLILDVTTTPFEKVLKILAAMKKFLLGLGKFTLKSDVKLSDFISHCSSVNLFEVTDELNWVIRRIQSHTLYTYEVYEDDDLESLKKDNLEMESFLEMLSDYSEAKEIKRRNKMPISRTHILHEKPFLIRQDFPRNLNPNETSLRKKKRESMLNQMSEEMIKNDQCRTDSRRINQTGVVRNVSKKEEIKDGKNEFKKFMNLNTDKNINGGISVNIASPRLVDRLTAQKTTDGIKDAEKLKGIKSNLGLVITRPNPVLGKKSSKEITSHKMLLNILNEDDKNKNILSIQAKDDSFSSFNKLAYEDNESNKQEKVEDKIDETSMINLIKIEDVSKPEIKNINDGIPKITFNLDTTFSVEDNLKLSWDTDNYSMCDPKAVLSRDFNIHEFSKQFGKNNTLPYIGKMIITAFDLNYLIDTTKLDSFLCSISKGYYEVPYHNSIHGADVTQTLANWIFSSNIEERVSLTDNEILAVLSASLAHDINHPGTNNSFQINSYSEYALTYNDQSVLENYHCSFFFKLSRNADNNIYNKFTDTEYRQFRKRIIECLIATDMVFHAKIVSQMKGKIMIYKELIKDLPETKEIIPMITKESTNMFDEQQSVLNFMIHSADIAHNSKPFKISYKWTEYLMEEFWQQGDKEKKLGLPISFLCDRTTADVPKGQIGFFKAIIIPTFDTLIDFLPDLTYVREQIDRNYEEWGKLIDENKPATLFAKSPRLLRSPNVIARLNANKQLTNNSVFGSLLGLGTKKLK